MACSSADTWTPAPGRSSQAQHDAGIDRRKDTPFQARNFLQALRGLFRWAVNAEFVVADSTNGVNASRPRTQGFRVWTEDEIDRFEARWPIGTCERLALVGYYKE